ncbi:MAG TPA: hypothetical protein DCY15_07110 [Ruminococcaceae bacterium]|nr:hypothetical protein [Oscillospiraceae bacterium]
MQMTPKLLGVFAKIYGSNDVMNFGKAALVAVVGFITVIVVLAVIALFIKAIAFIFDKSAKKSTNPAPAAVQQTAPVMPVSQPAQSGVELVNVDEPTAAVIMAIVSHQSGISLDRLAFKSIKLSEDK